MTAYARLFQDFDDHRGADVLTVRLGMVTLRPFFDMYWWFARDLGPCQPSERNALIRSRRETGPSLRLI